MNIHKKSFFTLIILLLIFAALVTALVLFISDARHLHERGFLRIPPRHENINSAEQPLIKNP